MVQGSDDKRIFALCDVIRKTRLELHRYLRYGHLEKVYENGLLINFGAPKLFIKKFVLTRTA